MDTWMASTPDGIALWAGDHWTGDPAVSERVRAQLAGGPTIRAMTLCPAFPTAAPIGPEALLAALISEYGGDLVAPGAPFDVVVPPITA